jgi:hypothetical protein
MGNLSKGFARNAAKDLKAWDCALMYPPPTRTKVDVGELIMGTITKAFSIFNQVKGMLPEGMMKNMKIPGLPEGMQAQVGDMVGKF